MSSTWLQTDVGSTLAFEVTEGQRHDIVPAPGLVERTRHGASAPTTRIGRCSDVGLRAGPTASELAAVVAVLTRMITVEP